MKLTFYFFLLSLLILCFSCSETVNSKNQKGTKTSVDQSVKSDSVQLDSTDIHANHGNDTLHKKRIPTHTWYVKAKSGLNFRKTPKGEVLGKFPLNKQVYEVERTGIKEVISDNGHDLSGEWIGVLLDDRAVYVFDAFLTEGINFSEIEIYYCFDPNRNSEDSGTSFINLSEAPYIHGINSEVDPNDDYFIPKDKLGQEIISLSNSIKSKFINQTHLTPTDKIFIYCLQSDTVYTYNLSDLKFTAILDPYSYGEKPMEEYNYQFGFLIHHQTKTTMNQEENFVYVGQHNPFLTGDFKTITWNKITSKDPDSDSQLDFLRNGYHYVISETAKNSMEYLLNIYDTSTGKLVHEQTVSSSEGISPAPLNEIRTGNLFKNKPPVIYGLRYHSFSCRSIFFLDSSEPPIGIRCDNRH